MSVATEFAPTVFIPERARTQGAAPGLREGSSATILTLRRPSAASIAPQSRLTRRGMVVLAVAVAALAGALVWLAALSAPSASPAHADAPATVMVRSGDTLWSIASQVAPDRDPRSEIATLQHLNHLDGVALNPGQLLTTR